MRSFCKKFKIKYEKCLNQSKKINLKWWGDKITKWISGVNKNFKNYHKRKFFFKRDLIFFQFLTENIIKKYRYGFFYKKKKIIFNFLPMKCEILVWKNTLKFLFLKGFRWKHLLSITFFYLKKDFVIK